MMEENLDKKISQKKQIRLAAELFFFIICTLAMAVILIKLTDDVDLSGGGFDNYYALEKNSVDVIFFGSSHAGCSVNIPMLWDEKGIAAFTLSASAQPAECTRYYMEEALKTQTPKVVFVETYLFAGEGPDSETGLYSEDISHIYWSTMNMRYSPLYVKMVMNEAGLYGFELETVMDLLLKVPVLHGDISGITMENACNVMPFSMGYYGENSTGNAEAPAQVSKRRELPDKNRESLLQIMDICRKKDIPLVLFCTPYPASKKELAMQNTIADMAAENGVRYLDVNTLAAGSGIDFSEDLRSDSAHLNNSGASKLTGYLLEQVLSEYDIPDHHGDARYAAWDDNSRFFEDRQVADRLQRAEDLGTYLRLLGQVCSDYDVMVSLEGNYRSDSYASSLSLIGLPDSFYENGGAAFISDGIVTMSPEGALNYKQELKSAPRRIICQDEAFYLGISEFAPPDNGLLVVVYDPVLDRVVDHIHADVYRGLAIERPECTEPDIG